MKRSTGVLCGVLLICVGVWSGLQYRQARAEAAEAEARVQQAAAAAAERVRIAQYLSRPFSDYATGGTALDWSRWPASDWRDKEKAFYGKVLAGGKFDVLVVPFQVWGWGVDRATRSLMAAELAASVARSQKLKIPDVYLVAKALGEGQRRFGQDDIYKLADAMGVKRIVWGYAGHERKEKMAIGIVTQDHAGAARSGAAWTGPLVTKKFENIPFGDEVPAIQAYESLLPEILKAIGVDAPSPLFDQMDSQLKLAELPESPLSLLAPAANPAQDAYGFLVYNALTPAKIERTREIFAEKAHLALLGLSPASPEYRALRARTYMALGLRMAAIKVLDEPKTPEEKELLAALNGNILEVRAIAAAEKNPLKRLLQKLDENRIGTAYQILTVKKSLAEAAALKLPGPVWPFIVTRAFAEGDGWSQYDNSSLKMLLDHELPVKGYSLKDTTAGTLPLTDPDKVQAIVDLSVFHHGRKFIDANAGALCCEPASSGPGPLDYLELLQGIGHDNLMRRINFLSQGNASKALSFADSIDGIYKGYPYYALERSRAEEGLATNAGGAEKEELTKAAQQSALTAIFWEQGQSLVSAGGRAQFHRLGGEQFGYRRNLYDFDVPFRPYYAPWGWGANSQPDRDNYIAALKNSTMEMEPLHYLLKNYRQYPENGRTSDLLQSISARFVGSPLRYELLSDEALLVGDNKAAEAHLRDSIKVTPDFWNSYDALGSVLIELGDFNAAARVFHSYEGFKNGSEESRVVLANRAFRAGSRFYWSGHFDLAAPLYRIAVSQRSGASSEMISAARLKFFAGDIQGAMVDTLRHAQRYQEPRAFRDYLGLLHASGHSEEAWAGFAVLAKQNGGPDVWESALVGHHMAALPEADVVSWAQQGEFRSTPEGKNALAIHLVRYATTDRTPSSGLSQVIAGLDQPRWKVPGHSWPRTDASPELRDAAEKQLVKSMHAYFVEGYRAIKLKEFAAAKLIFDEALTVYGITNRELYATSTTYLPYYAFAAAKAGDTSGVEKAMSYLQSFDRGFDYYLAKAILAGASGKSEEALQFLLRARLYRPATEARPLLTPYTFGEISVLVAEMTGSEKIRALALEWSKKNQTIEPWLAWPYALEAKLAKNPGDRQRAIAMTAYLDPKSEILSGFDRSEIDAAVKAFGKSNPLLAIKPEVVKKRAM
jgi:hypothetical protein